MTQEQKIRKQLDESMPDIIGALKLKIKMLKREIDTAGHYGQNDPGNTLHIVNCTTELFKTRSLLKKLGA